jgi:hypothetical protein
MVNHTFVEGPNPLIDQCSTETLVNVQAMLSRIQAMQIDLLRQERLGSLATHTPSTSNQCLGNEFYVRLLLLVQDAIEHEIEKATDPSIVHQYTPEKK